MFQHKIFEQVLVFCHDANQTIRKEALITLCNLVNTCSQTFLRNQIQACPETILNLTEGLSNENKKIQLDILLALDNVLGQHQIQDLLMNHSNIVEHFETLRKSPNIEIYKLVCDIENKYFSADHEEIDEKNYS